MMDGVQVKMASDILSLEDQSEIQVLPSLYQTTTYNRRVTIYRLNAVRPHILDAWSDHMCETLINWDTSKPYMVLFDLSNAGIALQYATLVNFNFQNIGITTEGGLRAKSIINSRPELMVYVAVCFNLTMSGRVGKLFSMQDFEDIHPRIHYKSFYTQTKGLFWLAEYL
jgi:hypothetical protein